MYCTRGLIRCLNEDPHLYAGAMENWGLITYREARLLVAPDSAAAAKQAAALVVGHEMAHMWFGNLVTMVGLC